MSDFYENEACQRGFFLELSGGYSKASEKYESIETIILAGIVIELRFASEKLRQIFLPALQHLCVEPSKDVVPRHTLCLWDRSSSGVAPTPPPFDKRRFTDRGDIWGYDNKYFQFAFLYGELSVNMYSRSERRGYYWVDDPRSLPYWCSAAPLRTLLHWCMSEDGRHLLHAAAIGTRDGALLLTGRGGIGKSSTALAGLQQGMFFSGDDYVVVGLDPEPVVYPLYGAAKVNRDQLGHYEKFLPYLTNPAGDAGEKAIFELLPRFLDLIPSCMPIKAILVPAVHESIQSHIGSDINLPEIKNAASLTTVEQLPYAGNETYQFIDKLCSLVPGFKLNLGSDRKSMVDYLKSWLREPGRVNSNPGEGVLVLNTPLTVIIPSYNREHLIDEAISNVIGQKYPDVELIVVDDGSTDETAARARSYSEVKVFEHPNSGPAQSRNRGIINARGQYIAFLDSDDLWPAGMLLELAAVLDKNPEVDVVMGWPQLAQWKKEGDRYEYFGNPCEGFDSYITGTIFRREVFSRVGLFDVDLNFGEDGDWFARARELGVNIRRMGCVSIIVRRHGNNMTEGKSLVELNVLRVFKKALDRKRSTPIS